jgi:hypothetical protein
MSWVSSVLFVLAALAGAWLADSSAIAIYLTGFWYYLLYGLAFTFRAIPLVLFKRDAIAMKSVAIAGLAAAYLAFPLDPLSLVVIACGILLNISAATALGSDRTYYGVEVAGLPPQRITSFPYSVVAHPMILGNVAAYGGTLLNAEFRRAWWPLAAAHVVLNIGLLLMELRGTRRSPGLLSRSGPCAAVWIGLGLALAGAGLGVEAARMGVGGIATLPAALLGASVCAYGWTLYYRYAGGSADAEPEPLQPRLFTATVGRFDMAADRAVIDSLVKWVEEDYREDLLKRSSRHVYIRTLPGHAIDRIDRLRDSAVVRNLIQRQFPAGSVITPMKHTDELYISNYNKDRGGDQGLFDKHYDGNLRFLSSSVVVRALIYLQSEGTYKVVFQNSQVTKAFATYDFSLLDFHRELHWVEGEYNPADRQRILLKCNYLITPGNAALLRRIVLAANTGVFYVVKSAMEYSKSPRTPAQIFVGILCNLFRWLNNIHPFVPLVFIVAVLAAIGWAIVRFSVV